MHFSVMTKNLNWEISTKNLVLIDEMAMGLMMKNFNIMGVHWKIDFLGGEVQEKKFFSLWGGEGGGQSAK